MKKFRKVLFWAHLVIGLTAGAIIAITVITGASMAFEKQVVAWVERDIRKVKAPSADAPRLSLKELTDKVREAQPEARPMSVVVAADPTEPVVFNLGRTNTVYLNPYTGDIQPQGAEKTRAFFAFMLKWHRWLGAEAPAQGGPGAGPSTNAVAAATAGPGSGATEAKPMTAREIGSTIMGIAATVFLLLSISGLYLWWPRHWNLKNLRAVSWPSIKLGGKARDWNWHNAFGFWASPVIIVMSFTGIVIAFHAVGDWIYKRPEGAAAQALMTTVPAPEPGTRPVSQDVLLASVQKDIPHWETITFRSANQRQKGGPRGGGMQRPAGESQGQPPAGETKGEGDPRRSKGKASAEKTGGEAVAAAGERPARGEGGESKGEGRRSRGEAGAEKTGSEMAATGEKSGRREGREDRAGAAGMGGPSSNASTNAPQPVVVAVEVAGMNLLPLQVQLDPFTGNVLRKEGLSDYGFRRGFRTLNRTLHTLEAFGWVGQLVALLACISGMVLIYTGFALSFRRWRNWRQGKAAQNLNAEMVAKQQQQVTTEELVNS